MKNRRGFTLVEIIICLSLIVVIGVASFFGIKTIRKNMLIGKLEQINDKILAATEVYIETNKETYNQLYEKKNGVIIPLNVLVNEGLLSLENTNIKQTDIEDEYVITALTSDTPSSTNDCIDIRTSTSWMNSSSAPIYICTDSSGNTNITAVNSYEVGNKNVVSRETFYYRGDDPKNYIKLKNGDGSRYRIISVNVDDSLVLYSQNSFGSSFNGKFQEVDVSTKNTTYGTATCVNGIPYIGMSVTSSVNSETGIDDVDFQNSSYCVEKRYLISGDEIDFLTYQLTSWLGVASISSWNFSKVSYKGSGSNAIDYYLLYTISLKTGYKIHLKNCMKITSGDGSYSNPFILEDKCS